MNKIIFTGFFLFTFFIESTVYGQRLTRAEVHDTIKSLPAFSNYQDNFIISGVPTNKPVNKHTADIKYQISFKQLVTRNTLPLDSYLFLTYTQKAFWNVYRKSSPFEEINYNPAIGLGKPVFNKEGYISGIAELQFEHESNGRAGEESRTWNRVSGAFHTPLGRRTILSVKAWAPFSYKKNNPDLLDYVGLGEIKVEQTIISKKLLAEVTFRKGLEDWKGSVGSKLYYKLFENSGKQYLMLEWFAGYAESLIDYNRYTSMVRVGYVVKSSDLNILKTR